MHEFVVKENIKKMKNHSLRDMIKLKQNLIDIEYKIKSGHVLDTKGAIEYAIIR